MKRDSFTLSIITPLPKETVQKVCIDNLKAVGGSIINFTDGFDISQGTIGLQHDNLFILNTHIGIQKITPTSYSVTCTMMWKPSSTYWNYFALGILIYFVMWPWLAINFGKVKPKSIYEPLLWNAKAFLERN